MQAVILAAGRGSRMGHLVDDRPKPMLEVNGRTLLEHKFDVLPDDVDEIILVVGYLANVIREKFGDSYKGKKIFYVMQENIVGGTADALWQAKELLHDSFLVMMGDDLYSREDIQALRAHEWALLVQRVADTSVGGKIVADREGHITDILEGNSGGEGAVSTNLFVLDTRLFEFPQIPKSKNSKELGLPQTVLAASKTSDIPFAMVEATRWIQITNPEDLAAAERRLGG